MGRRQKYFSRILFISDMHIPYQHPDTYEFLKALKKEVKPELVVCVGDELDYHAMSFHDSDPDLFSAGQELEASIAQLSAYYELFPEMKLVDSNHGSMYYRKGKHHGMPRHLLKTYHEILGAPPEWEWSLTLSVEQTKGPPIYVSHGQGSNNVLKVSQAMGMCAVQGHWHESFNIQYWANPRDLYWGMQIGCLINDRSYAFAYNKTNLKRPLIGTGIVIDGVPRLIPMKLNKKGRWTKQL